MSTKPKKDKLPGKLTGKMIGVALINSMLRNKRFILQLELGYRDIEDGKFSSLKDVKKRLLDD